VVLLVGGVIFGVLVMLLFSGVGIGVDSVLLGVVRYTPSSRVLFGFVLLCSLHVSRCRVSFIALSGCSMLCYPSCCCSLIGFIRCEAGDVIDSSTSSSFWRRGSVISSYDVRRRGVPAASLLSQDLVCQFLESFFDIRACFGARLEKGD